MKYLKIFIFPVIIIMAGLFYFFADPNKSLLMPKCPVKMITGYQCPSCGAQRAIHAFLHGNIIEAISYNLFFIVAIPFLLLTVYAFYKMKNNNPSLSTIRIYNFVTNRYVLLSYVFIFFAWWIVRNVIGC